MMAEAKPTTDMQRKLLFNNMTDLEQYAASVLDYSSKYNTLLTFSYAPENLTGKPVKYPMYGDFPDTYMLRSYGKWWRDSAATHKHYMPQDPEEILAEDFIVLKFEVAVVPMVIIIYETYNPGAVVRIWGRFSGEKWNMLWEEAPTVQRETSRKFTVELERVAYLINEIRLDLNQSLLNYHTALDAVLLSGKRPKTELQMNLLRKGFWDLPRVNCVKEVYVYNENKPSYFSLLPDEVIVKILSYLDIKSLSRCAQVNKTWGLLVKDTTIYRNLSLKKYWNKLDNVVLTSLMEKCRVLRKLDLSWCGDGDMIKEEVFISFLEGSCRHLTHLALCHCKFVQNASIEAIVKLEDLVELRLRNCQPNSWVGLKKSNLHKLETLDVCSTSITNDALTYILRENTNLKHLNIDLCEHLRQIDGIAEIVSTFNKDLISWSSWKTHTLTPSRLSILARCSKLEEIDIGWCCIPPRDPTQAFLDISMSCKRLKRLILSGWRNTSDNSLLPIIVSCKELRQLDLLGIKTITADICEKALSSLPHLELLDISFCDTISSDDVFRWRANYPRVVIQKSCVYTIPSDMWH